MTNIALTREEWMRKYIDYLDRCTGGTWQRYQLEQMASVAADSWMDDDPEQIAGQLTEAQQAAMCGRWAWPSAFDADIGEAS